MRMRNQSGKPARRNMTVHPPESGNLRMPALTNISTSTSVSAQIATSFAIAFFVITSSGRESNGATAAAAEFGTARTDSGASRGANPVAERAAHRQARAVAQHHLAVAVRGRDELHHALHVHDRGAMHADELRGIEFLLDRLQRRPDEMRRAAGVQLHVVVSRRDPVDFLGAQKEDASRRLDDESLRPFAAAN